MGFAMNMIVSGVFLPPWLRLLIHLRPQKKSTFTSLLMSLGRYWADILICIFLVLFPLNFHSPHTLANNYTTLLICTQTIMGCTIMCYSYIFFTLIKNGDSVRATSYEALHSLFFMGLLPLGLLQGSQLLNQCPFSPVLHIIIKILTAIAIFSFYMFSRPQAKSFHEKKRTSVLDSDPNTLSIPFLQNLEIGKPKGKEKKRVRFNNDISIRILSVETSTSYDASIPLVDHWENHLNQTNTRIMYTLEEEDSTPSGASLNDNTPEDLKNQEVFSSERVMATFQLLSDDEARSDKDSSFVRCNQLPSPVKVMSTMNCNEETVLSLDASFIPKERANDLFSPKRINVEAIEGIRNGLADENATLSWSESISNASFTSDAQRTSLLSHVHVVQTAASPMERSRLVFGDHHPSRDSARSSVLSWRVNPVAPSFEVTNANSKDDEILLELSSLRGTVSFSDPSMIVEISGSPGMRSLEHMREKSVSISAGEYTNEESPSRYVRRSSSHWHSTSYPIKIRGEGGSLSKSKSAYSSPLFSTKALLPLAANAAPLGIVSSSSVVQSLPHDAFLHPFHRGSLIEVCQESVPSMHERSCDEGYCAPTCPQNVPLVGDPHGIPDCCTAHANRNDLFSDTDGMCNAGFPEIKGDSQSEAGITERGREKEGCLVDSCEEEHFGSISCFSNATSGFNSQGRVMISGDMANSFRLASEQMKVKPKETQPYETGDTNSSEASFQLRKISVGLSDSDESPMSPSLNPASNHSPPLCPQPLSSSDRHLIPLSNSFCHLNTSDDQSFFQLKSSNEASNFIYTSHQNLITRCCNSFGGPSCEPSTIIYCETDEHVRLGNGPRKQQRRKNTPKDKGQVERVEKKRRRPKEGNKKFNKSNGKSTKTSNREIDFCDLYDTSSSSQSTDTLDEKHIKSYSLENNSRVQSTNIPHALSPSFLSPTLPSPFSSLMELSDLPNTSPNATLVVESSLEANKPLPFLRLNSTARSPEEKEDPSPNPYLSQSLLPSSTPSPSDSPLKENLHLSPVRRRRTKEVTNQCNHGSHRVKNKNIKFHCSCSCSKDCIHKHIIGIRPSPSPSSASNSPYHPSSLHPPALKQYPNPPHHHHHVIGIIKPEKVVATSLDLNFKEIPKISLSASPNDPSFQRMPHTFIPSSLSPPCNNSSLSLSPSSSNASPSPKIPSPTLSSPLPTFLPLPLGLSPTPSPPSPTVLPLQSPPPILSPPSSPEAMRKRVSTPRVTIEKNLLSTCNTVSTPLSSKIASLTISILRRRSEWILRQKTCTIDTLLPSKWKVFLLVPYTNSTTSTCYSLVSSLREFPYDSPCLTVYINPIRCRMELPPSHVPFFLKLIWAITFPFAIVANLFTPNVLWDRLTLPLSTVGFFFLSFSLYSQISFLSSLNNSRPTTSELLSSISYLLLVLALLLGVYLWLTLKTEKEFRTKEEREDCVCHEEKSEVRMKKSFQKILLKHSMLIDVLSLFSTTLLLSIMAITWIHSLTCILRTFSLISQSFLCLIIVTGFISSSLDIAAIASCASFSVQTAKLVSTIFDISTFRVLFFQVLLTLFTDLSPSRPYMYCQSLTIVILLCHLGARMLGGNQINQWVALGFLCPVFLYVFLISFA